MKTATVTIVVKYTKLYDVLHDVQFEMQMKYDDDDDDDDDDVHVCLLAISDTQYVYPQMDKQIELACVARRFTNVNTIILATNRARRRLPDTTCPIKTAA